MANSPRDGVNPTDPRISVIIPSVNGSASLGDCIASFIHQPCGDQIEIVVAESSADGIAEKICAGFSTARVIHFATRKSIPELRAAALLQARGSIIALTEDHCLADPHWVENVLDAHLSPALAIGGAVENIATQRLIDWAVFFCEYGRYMSPLRAGRVTDLPGPNVTYKRAALDHFRDLLAPATWEPFWHARLMSRGFDLVSDPRLVVYHRKNFTARGFLSERYHYARSFAGQRVRTARWQYRTMMIVCAPLLPPLLLWRIVRDALRKRRHCRKLFFSLPYLILFTISACLGEWVGYAFGAGASLEQIE